ncbi:unnamed protein product [Ectocarpus fasciculatus]
MVAAMIALQRGAGAFQRGLRQQHSRPRGSARLSQQAPRARACNTNTNTNTTVSVASFGSRSSPTAGCWSAGVSVHRNDHLRPLVLPVVPAAVALRSVQHLSSKSRGGRERGGADKRRRSNTSNNNSRDGEEKEEYTFLEKDDLGRLSSESKGGLKTDTAAARGAEDEQVDATNVTLWQRWKQARAKMKLLWKQYGLVWIGTYTVLYFGGLAGIYVVLDTGLVASDVDTSHAIQVLADYIGAQENPSVTWLQNTIKTNPKANTLLKAVIVNELIEYPRDIVAIAATPSIARALGRAPPKTKS